MVINSWELQLVYVGECCGNQLVRITVGRGTRAPSFNSKKRWPRIWILIVKALELQHVRQTLTSVVVVVCLHFALYMLLRKKETNWKMLREGRTVLSGRDWVKHFRQSPPVSHSPFWSEPAGLVYYLFYHSCHITLNPCQLASSQKRSLLCVAFFN